MEPHNHGGADFLSSSPNWSSMASPKWGFLSSAAAASLRSPWGDAGLGTGGDNDGEGEYGDEARRGRGDDGTIEREGSFNGAPRLKAEEFERRWVPPAVTSLLQALGGPAAPSRTEALEQLRQLLLRTTREHARQATQPHLATFTILANESPFGEIRKDFTQFLSFLDQELGLKPPASQNRISYFVSNTDIAPLEPEDQHTRRLFCNIFMQTGKLTRLVRILGWHSTYLDRYFQTMSLVMRASGPLPLHMRNYIAIVAASQYRCPYLVAQQEQEFLNNGGEATWLKGVDHVPKKISHLLEINAILAHEPWKITRDHIAVVVKGTDAWSIGELVHGLVIMATFRSLAGIVFGCGIAPEADLALPDVDPATHDHGAGAGFFAASPAAATSSGDYARSPRSRRPTTSVAVNPMHETVKILQALKEASPSPEPEPPLHTKRIVFENAGSEDPLGSDDDDDNDDDEGLTDVGGGSSGGGSGSGIRATRAGKLSRYIGPYRRTHADFDVHARDYSVFRVQDYSWKEHGYALVSRFYEDAAPLLDDQFDHIYYMTYHTISSHTDVDTAPFRESIWYYVHRIHGLLHEDYDYRNVNTYMNRAIKHFVKKVACFPDRIIRNDFENIGVDLRPEEKCHVALLAAEARKQAELLYGLHVVMQYMT